MRKEKQRAEMAAEMELSRSSGKCSGCFIGEVIVPKAALCVPRPVKNAKDC